VVATFTLDAIPSPTGRPKANAPSNLRNSPRALAAPDAAIQNNRIFFSLLVFSHGLLILPGYTLFMEGHSCRFPVSLPCLPAKNSPMNSHWSIFAGSGGIGALTMNLQYS
jgi:hypothetical protein